jgi:tetratricopeptide (TPR) repeat protein
MTGCYHKLRIFSASLFLFSFCNLAHAQARQVISDAKALLSDGEAKAAIMQLEPIWEEDSQNFELCQLLVDAYGDRIDQVNMFKKRGLAKKMLRTMEQCYDLNPDDEFAQLNLVMFHTQAPSIVGGDKSAAKRLIDEISQTHPTRGLLMRARLAVMNEDFEAASSFAEAAIEASPENTEALNVAGLIALQQDRYSEAMALFKRCVLIAPENYDCHYQIGKASHLSGNNTDGGITAFETFIGNGHEDPEYLAHAHYRLAELLIMAGDKARARAHLKKAIELADLKSAKKRLQNLERN